MNHDVVIVGDGPAGRALGAACIAAGVDVVVVGTGTPWSATYGAWVDEVGHISGCAACVMDIDVVGTPPRRRLDRRYLVFDNARLAAQLDVAPRLVARVASVQHSAAAAGTSDIATVVLDDGQRVSGRLVIDATGPRPQFLARRSTTAKASFQSAYGVVVDARPDVGGDAAILMDWRPPSVDLTTDPTFLYMVELGDGRWLVEETSLARRSPMTSDALRHRLAARVGRDLTDVAEHVEHVVIPMWPGVPARHQLTVGFGAAAGYVHPATGYSVAASWAAAPRVAVAIKAGARTRRGRTRTGGVERRLAVRGATGSRAARLRTGCAAAPARRCDAGLLRRVLRSPGRRLVVVPARRHHSCRHGARHVWRCSAAVPWSVRRRLAAGNPAVFAGLLR